WQIVKSCRNHQLACAVQLRVTVAINTRDREVAAASADRVHRLVLANVEPVMLRNFSVVLQGFGARGLLVGGGERNVADLQQLRSGEEDHVGGIVEERIDQASFINAGGTKAGALCFNRAREAGRSGADNQHI